MGYKVNKYRKGNGIGSSAPSWATDEDVKPKRRSFKQWLRDYLKEEPEIGYAIEAVPSTQGTSGFNKSFEGWNIRLHRANGGHIVEAWKNIDSPVHSSSYRPDHELFMVTDSEDMGTRINDILVQLMLRG
jgi:hypothetical protein